MKKIKLDFYCKFLTNYLNCEYELYDIVDKDIYLKRYNECIEEGKKQGYIPILIDADSGLTSSIKQFDYLGFNINKDLSNLNEFREKIIKNDSSEEGKKCLYEIMDELKFPKNFKLLNILTLEDKDINCISINLDTINSRYQPKMIIAKMPIKYTWEIIAYLPQYTFESKILKTEYHRKITLQDKINVFKYFFEEYQMEVKMVTGTKIVTTMSIKTVEKAKQLAKEVCAVCPERLHNRYGGFVEAANEAMKCSTFEIY